MAYDVAHLPIATLPGMRERTLTISSAGKTFSFTGWKVGWATGPAAPRARGADGQAVPDLRLGGAVPAGGRRRPAAAGQPTSTSCATTLRGKRDRLCAGLRDVGFDVFTPQGTYFVTADVRPLGWTDGVEFCRDLPHKAGVVAIPHQVFYDDVEAGRPLVRFAFCKRDEVLDEALNRLQALRPRSG